MGPEIGGGEGTTKESPPAGRVADETDYFRIADRRSESSLANFRADVTFV